MGRVWGTAYYSKQIMYIYICIQYKMVTFQVNSINIFDDMWTLVQVMACCLTASSHYLSQCHPRSMLPHGIARPQWVKEVSYIQEQIHVSAKNAQEINDNGNQCRAQTGCVSSPVYLIQGSGTIDTENNAHMVLSFHRKKIYMLMHAPVKPYKPVSTPTQPPLKHKSHNFVQIFVIECLKTCHFDHLWHSQWQNFVKMTFLLPDRHLEEQICLCDDFSLSSHEISSWIRKLQCFLDMDQRINCSLWLFFQI